MCRKIEFFIESYFLQCLKNLNMFYLPINCIEVVCIFIILHIYKTYVPHAAPIGVVAHSCMLLSTLFAIEE